MGAPSANPFSEPNPPQQSFPRRREPMGGVERPFVLREIEG